MASPNKASMPQVSPVAGVKRPPSLLPAFELNSSSPTLPPTKRVAHGSPSRISPSKRSAGKYHRVKTRYPTPVPTSSTGIFASSPPPASQSRRPPMSRTASAVSERVPLTSVPSIELDGSGEPTLMGRSRKSSHYQLSTNKLISRVHVRAAYVPVKPPKLSKIEVVCTGWNGALVHCQGEVFDLRKDDSFTTHSKHADIMIDVQDARVFLKWPKDAGTATTPEHGSVDSENSPRRDTSAGPHRSPYASPLRQRVYLRSPVSPSPAAQNVFPSSSTFLASDPFAPAVQVYEDEQSEDEVPSDPAEATQSTQRLTQPLGTNLELPQSFTNDDASDYSEHDEENDPVVHSFGPFGANLLPLLTAFTAGESPRVGLVPDTLVAPKRSRSESPEDASMSLLVNHVVNQLAYSRLSSTPLSTIMGNLPSHLKGDDQNTADKKLTMEALKTLIDETPCIGEVRRKGKDAAGQQLESEYYYLPEEDIDENRRNAVVDGLRKPGLRSCRKQHKQYYWRKPK